MKKFSLIISIIALFSFNQQSSSFGKIKLSVVNQRLKKTGSSSYELSFIVKYPDLTKEFFAGHRVPAIHNPYIIYGTYEGNTINERDFLFSRKNIDLNKNGKITDDYHIEKRSGNLFIDGKPAYNIISKRKMNGFTIFNYKTWRGKSKEIKITDNGIPFYIYGFNFRSKKIKTGIGSDKNPSKKIFMPNPSVEIKILKPVDSINDKPSYSISGGKTYYSLSNELFFNEYSDRWTGILSAIKKIDINRKFKSRMKFAIKNLKKPFIIMISCNFSVNENSRLQTKPVILNYVK